MNKHRLSASIDADLFVAAEKAVADGLAGTVSEWVNTAMRRQMEHDRRMRALDAFIAQHEAAHGVITEREMVVAARKARGRSPRAAAKSRRRSA